MPYSPMKKSSCIKMYDSKGKPAGLMAEGSMAYMESMGQEKSNLMQDMPIDNRGISQMSPYKMENTDPKDGVVVTGTDKTKSAGDARAERLAKRKQELADAAMKKKIAKANKIEELKFKQEEKKAAYAANRQRAEQKLKERQGRIPAGSEDTSTNYMRGPLNQNDPKKSGKTKKETKDAYINSMLDKLQKEKPGMNPMEMMKYAKNSYEALPPEKKEK